MGWLFSSRWPTRQAMIEHLRSPGRFSSGYSIVKSTAVGNHHWYLFRREADGKIFIGLDLMAGSRRRDGGWGYKDMDESCGPCEVDCPIGFLDAASPPENEYAAAWRDRVRKHHAIKQITPAPKAGLVVSVYRVSYELVRPAGARKGWVVKSLQDECVYRMPAAQLSRALRRLATETQEGVAA